METALSRLKLSWIKALMAALALALWLTFRHTPPVPDDAWLMEGARRWMNGATLYVDIEELNPPLIFYDLVGLSFGTMVNAGFVAGVSIATLITSLWVARHHGDLLGLGTFVSISFAGMIEFGQREHLFLIFVVPYLLARGSPRERALMGLWAFLGVGLKPYFLLVVVLPAIVEAWRDRRSIFAAQKLALAAACVAYVIAAYLLYPAYFTDIIPLGAAIYTYGISLPPLMLFETLIVGGVALLADSERRPLAAAAIGALACYYVQQRLWSYHFIPAAGLGMILCFWQRRLAYWALLLLIQAWEGPYPKLPPAPIPEGITRLVVLSVHPSAAYPAVTACGATNETPWGSIGWVPGPWNTVHDPLSTPQQRRQAWHILLKQRDRLRHDILASDTQLIISDAAPRKLYFEYPIDYMRFIGPIPGFKLVRRVGRYELWAKGPLSSRYCKERF